MPKREDMTTFYRWAIATLIAFIFTGAGWVAGRNSIEKKLEQAEKTYGEMIDSLADEVGDLSRTVAANVAILQRVEKQLGKP